MTDVDEYSSWVSKTFSPVSKHTKVIIRPLLRGIVPHFWMVPPQSQSAINK